MNTVSYFDTTDIKGPDLDRYDSKARSQEAIILDFFRLNYGRYFSPYEVAKSCFTERTPITSVRRALTVLTKKGLLIRLNKQVHGEFDRPCHCWTLPIKNNQTRLF